ncbi:molecular chaperone DnaJ [Raoultella ornithinolytica]|uniref:hypothetical protein n=1 Tax=Raoultella ornithinolytica TaxID=54291 RepID=UPI0011596923|nr:hypothetical protein [Raoultella ornithinolytica]
MSKKKRTIKCLTNYEMYTLLNNKDLSNYIFNYKSNNKLSSAPEMTVIAYMLSFFKPINFIKLDGSNVLISGCHGDYTVNFKFQEKVYNPKTKRTLSIDLTIELFDADEDNRISKVGIEYDEHPNHVTAWGVVEDKEKDLVVLKQTGMQRIRVDPDMFQTSEDRKDIYRAVKKYFEQYIKLRPKKRHKVGIANKYSECPLCEGIQVLGAYSCPVCLGNGVVKRNMYSLIDIDVFSTFDCPDCTNRSNRNCKKCRGTGFLNREEAIRFRKEELNRT